MQTESVQLSQPDVRIQLEMPEDHTLDVLRPDIIKIQSDGSYLGYSLHYFYHWDKNGKLIVWNGGEGEGPGLFSGIVKAIWDGNNYWIMNGMPRLVSLSFDAKANYMHTKPLFGS